MLECTPVPPQTNKDARPQVPSGWKFSVRLRLDSILYYNVMSPWIVVVVVVVCPVLCDDRQNSCRLSCCLDTGIYINL